MKILCVEDDEGLARLLQQALMKQHYQVELAADGETAWELIEADAYDLILLDWMLPNVTGIQLCQKLRSEHHAALNPNRDTPVLLMTALEAVTNRVMGLDAGADDYVVKPFALEELLARIRALLRRTHGSRSPLCWWGDLCLNPNSCEVTYQGHPIQLAAKEYELLELFLRNPDQIFSLDRLLAKLWVSEETPSEGAVRAHIKGLRQKLKQAGVVDPIETLYKLGYRLRPWQGARSSPVESQEPSPPSKPTQASSESVASEIPLVLFELWQECRQSYCDRLMIIHDATQALQQGTLTAAQQHAAEREAHTLIGSLGSFGLERASRLSRQVQQILKQPTLTPSDVTALTALVCALQECLEPLDETGSQAQGRTVKHSAVSCLTPVLLIVDDDLALAQELSKEALSWGLRPEIALTPHEALRFLQDCPIDAVLLDLNFTDSVSHGLDLLAAIHQQYPTIPVVVLTAEEKFENRVRAARLGSRCFLQKPIAPSQVLTAVTQLMPLANRLSTRILVVDDDPALLNLVKTLLEPYGYDVTLLSAPDQFWRTLEQVTPDLVILDVELSRPSETADASPPSATPDAALLPLNGIELCQVIRNDPRWNRLPVLFLSAHGDIATVQQGFTAGADDFLSKPVIAQELLTRVRTRLEQRKLWGANDLDELTGVSLRRRALQDLTRLIRLAQRQHHPFTLALLDIDHFKQVNDQYGHDVGDQVLHHLGKLLRQSFREEDIVGRWGGEEFIIGMYGITEQEGKARLEEVLHQLSNYGFLSLNGTSFYVTFSAGVSQLSNCPSVPDELKALYHCADQALYQAKSAGRSRVVVAKAGLEPGESFNQGNSLP